jgi:DNA-binding FadR family transcriptional regulator
MSRLNRKPMRLLMVDIIDGALQPGDTLPRESDLAMQFGVSRGVMRETLRGLEDRGLIIVKHGRATVVAPARDWNVLDADVLAVMVQSAAAPEVLREFLEARQIIEIEAAARAAERATEADLKSLAQALANTEESVKRAAVNRAAEGVFYESDIEFHQTVLAASGNRVLARLTSPIQRALLETRRPLARPQARVEERVNEHRRIVSAIANRDPQAAREAMAHHLESVKEMLAHDITDRPIGGTRDELDWME